MKTLSWRQKFLLKKVIKKKCQVFQQLGYSSVNEDELINYLLAYRWRHKEKMTLKARRKDIQQIEPNDFFDFQQLKAQTSTLQLNDWHDLEDLF
ncbi:post-transcriptional regulator [Enterococcus faecalis]